MRRIVFGSALVAAMIVSSMAHAKSARCFTTDDGYYNCYFKSHGGDGSFTISAPGYPTIVMTMIRRGVGYVDANFGSGRYVSFPGEYHRSRQDGACWISNTTGHQVCAW